MQTQILKSKEQSWFVMKTIHDFKDKLS